MTTEATEAMGKTEGVVEGVVQRSTHRRKPTRRLVARLESEITGLKKELELAAETLSLSDKRLAEANTSLTAKNDELLLALNQRDGARSQRDIRDVWIRDDKAEYNRNMTELLGDLRRLQAAQNQLMETNRNNFDKSARSGDVSAVLVACLVEATCEDPVKTMERVVRTGKQMGVSSEVLGEVEVAFKRAYMARIEQTVDAVVDQTLKAKAALSDVNDINTGIEYVLSVLKNKLETMPENKNKIEDVLSKFRFPSESLSR